MYQLFFSPLAVLLSLTGTGVVLHETKVDKLAVMSLSSSAAVTKKVTTYGAALLETMPHTHSEGNPLNPSSRELRTHSPSLTPRRDKDKYRMPKSVPRGQHLFDSYHLPLDALTV